MPLRSALLVFPCIFLPGAALAKEPCIKTALQKILSPTPKVEKLTDSVDLLYYPKAGYLAISHVELRVKDKVWEQMSSTIEKAAYEVAERKAKQGGYGFYRFRLRATPEEVERLETYLRTRAGDGKVRIQSCVSGACDSLNQAGILYVPPPLSKVPLLSAVYLRVLSLTGARRIESVHFIGKSQIRSLIATEIVSEANISFKLALIGVAVVEGIDSLGHRFIEWIGIEGKESKGAAGGGPSPTPSVSPR
ncbi:hypothetical protein EB061_01730 [bacterium]|jgi:hypothetical protein|nr:hypothetical protein [bacterium]